MEKTLVLFVVLGLFIFNNNVYAKWHPFSHAGENSTKPLAEAVNKFTDTFGKGFNKISDGIYCSINPRDRKCLQNVISSSPSF